MISVGKSVAPEWSDELTPRQRQLLRMEKGPGAMHAADVHFRSVPSQK